MVGFHALPARMPLRHTLKPSRRFSTSSWRPSYADTLPNLKIGAHTRVLFQGFTGKCPDELHVIVLTMDYR